MMQLLFLEFTGSSVMSPGVMTLGWRKVGLGQITTCANIILLIGIVSLIMWYTLCSLTGRSCKFQPVRPRAQRTSPWKSPSGYTWYILILLCVIVLLCDTFNIFKSHLDEFYSIEDIKRLRDDFDSLHIASLGAWLVSLMEFNPSSVRLSLSRRKPSLFIQI